MFLLTPQSKKPVKMTTFEFTKRSKSDSVANIGTKKVTSGKLPTDIMQESNKTESGQL